MADHLVKALSELYVMMFQKEHVFNLHFQDNHCQKQNPAASLSFNEGFMMTSFCFLSQLFFPETMISDSADVTKDMTSSELIQVDLLKSHRFM